MRGPSRHIGVPDLRLQQSRTWEVSVFPKPPMNDWEGNVHSAPEMMGELLQVLKGCAIPAQGQHGARRGREGKES